MKRIIKYTKYNTPLYVTRQNVEEAIKTIKQHKRKEFSILEWDVAYSIIAGENYVEYVDYAEMGVGY